MFILIYYINHLTTPNLTNNNNKQKIILNSNPYYNFYLILPSHYLKKWSHPDSNWGHENQNLGCCPYTMRPYNTIIITMNKKYGKQPYRQ